MMTVENEKEVYEAPKVEVISFEKEYLHNIAYDDNVVDEKK